MENNIIDQLEKPVKTFTQKAISKFKLGFSLLIAILLLIYCVSLTNQAEVRFFASFLLLGLYLFSLYCFSNGVYNGFKSYQKKEKASGIKAVGLYGNLFFILLFLSLLIQNILDAVRHL
jgi:hypothetical protein